MFDPNTFVSPFTRGAQVAVRAFERAQGAVEARKADVTGATLRGCVAIALAQPDMDGAQVARAMGAALIFAEGSKAKSTVNAYRSAISWLFGGAKDDVTAGKERLATMRRDVGDVSQMSAEDFGAAVTKAAEPFVKYWADYKAAGDARKAADKAADAAAAESKLAELPADPLLAAVQDALRAIRTLQAAGEPAAQYVADLRAFLDGKGVEIGAVTEHVAKAA